VKRVKKDCRRDSPNKTMTKPTELTSLIIDHSSKLDELLAKLDAQLREVISTLPPEKQIDLYGKLSQQIDSNLSHLKK
jgi:hypothetical protein